MDKLHFSMIEENHTKQEYNKLYSTLTFEELNEVNEDGMTPLMKASYAGNLDAFYPLMECNLIINLAVQDYTALDWAYYGLNHTILGNEKDYLEIINFLIAHDAKKFTD